MSDKALRADMAQLAEQYLVSTAPEHEQPDDITVQKAMAAGWGNHQTSLRELRRREKAGELQSFSVILSTGRRGLVWRRKK